MTTPTSRAISSIATSSRETRPRDARARLAAFIVARPDRGVNPAALRDYLKDKVSRYEQPRDIEIVPEIPRNPAGKVLRNELQT